MEQIILSTKIKVTKVNNKNSAYVKQLNITEGDELEISMPVTNTANWRGTNYARYVILANLTKFILKENVSLNTFVNALEIGVFEYTKL